MNYYFLTGLFPLDQYKEIIANSKGSIHYAADALQKSFADGFSEVFDNLEIVNLPFVQPYPQGYRKMFVSSKETIYRSYTGKQIECHGLAFCNLYEYKKISIERSAYKYFDSVLRSTKESICIIIYAITTSTLNVCYRLKKKYGRRVKSVLIVPDLPQHTYDNTKLLHRLYFEHQRKEFARGYKCMDAFVLLSKYMAEALPVEDKRWVVVEGIYNPGDETTINNGDMQSDLRTVFYAGTLSLRYGVKELVDAFMMTDNPNFRLQLCGYGDGVKYVEECRAKDSRLEYLGQLPRKRALEYQREASLLVNPRTSKGVYTKYSFPSKTMEYFASGVPTLLYKLPGIPDEYFSYCFSLEDERVEVLSQMIEEILSMESVKLKEIGYNARQFVCNQKNPFVQCSKVKAMIEKLN